MAAGTLTVELSVIEDYGYVCVFLRVINKLSFLHLSCVILVLMQGQSDLSGHGLIGILYTRCGTSGINYGELLPFVQECLIATLIIMKPLVPSAPKRDATKSLSKN